MLERKATQNQISFKYVLLSFHKIMWNMTNKQLIHN